MVRNILKLSVGAVLAALFVTACSKSDEPPALPPVVPQKKADQSDQAPPDTADLVNPAVAVPKAVRPAVPIPQGATPDAATGQESPSQIQAAYQANSDYQSRVENIHKLSDLETSDAVGSLAQLFKNEKDEDLKTEILDSLFEIDGLDKQKATLLALGAMPDQSQDVRQHAIDGLGDIDGKFAIPILQSYTSDPDEDIRESAKDTIEQLQAEEAGGK